MKDSSGKKYKLDDVLATVQLDRPEGGKERGYIVTVDGAYIDNDRIDIDFTGQAFESLYKSCLDPISSLLVNSKYLAAFSRAKSHYHQLPADQQDCDAVSHVQILQWARWLITHNNLDGCPELSKFEQNLQSLLREADSDLSFLVTSDHVMEAHEYSERYESDINCIYRLIKNHPQMDTLVYISHDTKPKSVDIQEILDKYKGRQTASEEEIEALIDLGYSIETKSKNKNPDDIKKAKQLYGLAYCLSDNNNIAANNLGYLTSLEASGEQDISTAITILTFAADHGNDIAMVNLGNIYEGTYDGMTSDDFKPNPKQAAKWYLMAGMMGNKSGIYNYANLLHWGRGVRKDYATAFRLFRYLHNKYQMVDATFYLGMYYESGHYVDQNYTKAVKYYQEAADQNDPYSYCQLGRLYSLGNGVDKDGAKGVELYLKAGELGDPLGYANAAYAYEHGEGVDKDMELARKYYHLAADQGEEHAIEWLEQHPEDS